MGREEFFSVVLMIILGGLLVSLLAVAGRTSGPLRYLLYAQTIFWAVCYLARPLLLVLVSPQPRANDSIADFRIAGDSYLANMAPQLALICTGLFFFVVVATVLLRCLRATGNSVHVPTAAGFPLAFSTSIYLAGWVCRAATLVGISNPVISSSTAIAGIGAGLIILRSDFSNDRWVQRSLLVGTAVVGEVLYGILNDSKTPALMVALLLLIKFAGKLNSIARLLAVPVAATCAFAVFTFIQSLKNSEGVARDLVRVDSTYPLLLRPVLPLVRRFDLFSAVTDASFVGGSRWMEFQEVLLRIFASLFSWVPGQTMDGTAGILWAREVRGATIALNGSTVSLAEGFIAEGWVLGGVIGIVVGATTVAALTFLVGRGLQSNSALATLLATSMLSVPILFERGILGISENVGQLYQAALVCYVLHLVWPAARRRGVDSVSDIREKTMAGARGSRD